MPHVHTDRLLRLAVPFALLLGGCRDASVQSALHPAGPAAEKIAWLTWVMVGAFTAVFVLVIGLIGYAVFRRPGGDSALSPPPFGGNRFIVVGGVVFPVVVL